MVGRWHPRVPIKDLKQCTAIFISCKPPVDPVELVVKYIEMVEDTGITRTRYSSHYVYHLPKFINLSRYVHRLVPVSETCTANLPEIEALCRDVFKAFFEKHPETLFTVSRYSGRSRSILSCPETLAAAVQD